MLWCAAYAGDVEIEDEKGFDVRGLVSMPLDGKPKGESPCVDIGDKVSVADCGGVKVKPPKYKAWRDPKILNPILKKCNGARQWVLMWNAPEAHTSYQEWQFYFQQEVSTAKARHWKSWLACSKGCDIFKPYKFTKPLSII